MKIITVALLALSLAGCADYFYKKNEDNFWGKATPSIGKIVND